MQLVAYGAQDFYLTGNPQITFFKVVYRRHTNFATESIEQTFNGSAAFNGKAVCNIQRSGDLITKMYLRTTLTGPDVSTKQNSGQWAWVRRVGHALMTEIVLEIGGTQIDKHYGDWLNIWYELARNFAHDRGYNVMIGNTPELNTLDTKHDDAVLWIPLQFACCRNDGLALPVIALQYHDIKITLTFNSAANLINKTALFGNDVSGFSMGGTTLFVDYVYLDNEERKRFAQASHEYLFEQLQYTGAESINSNNAKIRLNLNHPCKELVWVNKYTKFTSGNDPFLAYDANNSDFTRVIATKRFVLRCADYTNGVLSSHAGAVTPKVGLPVNLLNLFNAIAPVSLTNLPDNDNVTVLGRLLTTAEVSQTVTQLFGTFATSAPLGTDGHPSNDVFLNLNDNYGVHLDGSLNPTVQALLQLNSHDRFTEREGVYFNYVQPWQCHTNTPADGVNVYSFALHPEDHQPSGTCNMSRIDNATLGLKYANNSDPSNVQIYATNYNVLRIMSGMGGLAYSN